MQELLGNEAAAGATDEEIAQVCEQLDAKIITANAKDFPNGAVSVPGNLSASGQLQYILWKLGTSP